MLGLWCLSFVLAIPFVKRKFKKTLTTNIPFSNSFLRTPVSFCHEGMPLKEEVLGQVGLGNTTQKIPKIELSLAY